MFRYFRRLRGSIRRRFEGIINNLLCRFPKSQFIKYCGIIEKYVSGLSSDHKAELIEFINSVTKKKDGKALDKLYMLRRNDESQDIEHTNGGHVIVASKSNRDAAARRVSMRASACC